MTRKKRKPRPPLTPAQHLALIHIKRSIADTGRPPTRRELGLAMGIVSNGVAFHLARLVAKGYIAIDRCTSRGIRVLP